MLIKNNINKNKTKKNTSYLNKDHTSIITENRPPIVSFMGHVDHGKTSLLNYIRNNKIIFNEIGNITQNIKAYCVKTKKGIITFIDTPGHAVFSNMRSKGVCITDIVVLVIAIDDGIMPQTIESINYAQSAKIPIIVAINKIDKKNTNYIKIQNELTKFNILSEEWGGKNKFVYVSAKHGIGIDSLLDAILYQTKSLNLKIINNNVYGIVIESFLDKKIGPTAIIIMRNGILNIGNVVLCGYEYGKIRIMYNEIDQIINVANPSIPVKISGLSGVPLFGDKLIILNNEKKAKKIATFKKNEIKIDNLVKSKKNTSNNVFENICSEKKLELKIIIKSNIQSTIESINNAINEISREKIKINVIYAGVGNINENDIMLAISTQSFLLGFNVDIDVISYNIIKEKKIDLYRCSIIYDLIDKIKKKIDIILNVNNEKKITNIAKVKNVFHSSKITIAGCIINNGIFRIKNKIKLIRNNKCIYKGELKSIHHFKKNVYEIHHGMECGLIIDNYNDIYVNDFIETI